ncbi:MAG TPA: hypothetical protein VK573_00300 [Gemmatimonadales bacterium]|nr:hypothetical protein [Gemmatimonadales bacterium]
MRISSANGLAVVALLVPLAVPAQQPTPPPLAPLPVADSQDVRSVDAILTAVYQVISGDSGVARNWNTVWSDTDNWYTCSQPTNRATARQTPLPSHGASTRSSSSTMDAAGG